jgi:hypothetical protein
LPSVTSAAASNEIIPSAHTEPLVISAKVCFYSLV